MTKIFYAFVEFDGDFGKDRKTRGFRKESNRTAWVRDQYPGPGQWWSDLETWEADESEWPHVKIIG